MICAEKRKELIDNAAKISRSGFGILAADESVGTLGKKFTPLNIENTEENRRRYRELLLTTEDLEKHISGVILFEETVDQKTADGTSFMDILAKKGILAGIKLDKGTKPIMNTDGELHT